jgi:AAA lid domain
VAQGSDEVAPTKSLIRWRPRQDSNLQPDRYERQEGGDQLNGARPKANSAHQLIGAHCVRDPDRRRSSKAARKATLIHAKGFLLSSRRDGAAISRGRARSAHPCPRIGRGLIQDRNSRERFQEAGEAFIKYIALRRTQPFFSNARSIRNALDRIRLRHADRLVSDLDRTLDVADLETIDAADILASRVFAVSQATPAEREDEKGTGAMTRDTILAASILPSSAKSSRRSMPPARTGFIAT